ncbi:unnamed protein product [Bemisia tabaci]|uniref:Uncharacterized protein n=1 Tax=Bemisia tabaci TaxID=7038 RepID=A0A9P0APK3_BEMTA|nr:unnamed protein product [Bemisia tabaci]
MNSEHSRKLIYNVNEKPPACVSFTLGFQKILNTLCNTVVTAHLLSTSFCILDEDPLRSHILSSIIFFSAAASFIQSSLGTRLPLSLNVNFLYVVSVVLFLRQDKCSTPGDVFAMGPDGRTKLWHSRIASVQGAVMLAAVLTVVIGSTGCLGKILRFVSPLTVFPMIVLTIFSIFNLVMEKVFLNWYISGGTLLLIVIFSQYLRSSPLPVPTLTFQRGCYMHRTEIFQILAVPFAVILAWIICWFLTYYDALSARDMARTDTHVAIISHTPIINIFSPFYYGFPTLSVSSFLLMLPAVLMTVMESVDQQNACCVLCQKIPSSKITHRGVLVEGVTSALASVFGVPAGMSPSQSDIADIESTKVSSRCVVQGASIILMLISLYGPLGAFLTLVPVPIIGALMLNSCVNSSCQALSYLWYIERKSKRNTFIITASIFLGYIIPNLVATHPELVETSVHSVDVVDSIKPLLKSYVFIGGLVAFLLDVSIPAAAPGESGLSLWRRKVSEDFNLSEVRTCSVCRASIAENGTPTSEHSNNVNVIDACFLAWLA